MQFTRTRLLDDLRGLLGLAAHATGEVTNVIEGVHQAVLGTLGFRGNEHGGTSGLTGLVYGGVRAATRGIAGAGDRLLELLATDEAQAAPSSAQRDALVAVLNGVFGDRLAALGNPLALPMSLRHRGEALPLDGAMQIEDARPRVLLMIHGLCMNDLQWRSTVRGRVHDHGEHLADGLDHSLLHLRYNSGLRIAENGMLLSDALERLVTGWPVPIERISVVAHSMGGLVMRSALRHAELQNLEWSRQVHGVVFLGTPHHGAPLERIGHRVHQLLHSNRFSAPFARLAALRSAGIADLRHGAVDENPQEAGEICRLPAHIRSCAIAASLGNSPNLLAERVTGDGLVPLRSALGQHDDPSRDLAIPPERRHVAWKTSHMALLSRPELAQRMLDWLA